MKVCSKCGVEKNESEFGKRDDSRDGLRNDCKKCRSKHGKQYYEENKNKINEYKKQYYKEHSEEICKSVSKYQKNHRKERNKYIKERRITNINFSIAGRLRNRIYDALKGHCKSKKTLQLLGCSIEEFKKWLESQFYNNETTCEQMGWDNYGSWEIDHIIPCALFILENSEEQEICFHFTNMQPLWAEDNLKKSNKF